MNRVFIGVNRLFLTVFRRDAALELGYIRYTPKLHIPTGKRREVGGGGGEGGNKRVLVLKMEHVLVTLHLITHFLNTH